MCIQLILYTTMADAPPWPNLVFDYTILICPIIIWLLLLIFPPAFANLLKCHQRSGGTLLHQQRRSLTPRHHNTSRKKREFRQPPPFQHLLYCSKGCAITLFAAAWFVYKLGCNLESFVQQEKTCIIWVPTEHLHQTLCSSNSTPRCEQRYPPQIGAF